MLGITCGVKSSHSDRMIGRSVVLSHHTLNQFCEKWTDFRYDVTESDGIKIKWCTHRNRRSEKCFSLSSVAINLLLHCFQLA